MRQGSVFLLSLTHNDSGGSPVLAADVTSAAMQVRENIDDATALLDIDSTSEITISDGLIEIEVSAAVTAAITPTDTELREVPMVYDLEVTYADTRVERVLEGNLTFSQEVTR